MSTQIHKPLEMISTKREIGAVTDKEGKRAKRGVTSRAPSHYSAGSGRATGLSPLKTGATNARLPEVAIHSAIPEPAAKRYIASTTLPDPADNPISRQTYTRSRSLDGMRLISYPAPSRLTRSINLESLQQCRPSQWRRSIRARSYRTRNNFSTMSLNIMRKEGTLRRPAQTTC